MKPYFLLNMYNIQKIFGIKMADIGTFNLIKKDKYKR